MPVDGNNTHRPAQGGDTCLVTMKATRSQKKREKKKKKKQKKSLCRFH
jgi:hypothetical protein